MMTSKTAFSASTELSVFASAANLSAGLIFLTSPARLTLDLVIRKVLPHLLIPCPLSLPLLHQQVHLLLVPRVTLLAIPIRARKLLQKLPPELRQHLANRASSVPVPLQRLDGSALLTKEFATHLTAVNALPRQEIVLACCYCLALLLSKSKVDHA